MVEDGGLLGYEELAVAIGRSVGAVRNMKLRGQLPEPDAPGPKWRRSSLVDLLKEGAPVPAGGPSAVAALRSDAGAPADTPERSEPATVPPVTREPFTGTDAEDIRRRAMTLAEILACPHPAGDRKVTGYMTMCVVCGRRMEGRDRWAGAGWAGWDKAKLAACTHPVSERRAHLSGHAQCGVCDVLLKASMP